MFRAAWTWLVPLAGGVAAFSAVLLTTPPGFASVPQVVFFTSRGPTSDAAAYALGAASALALLALVILGAVCLLLEQVLKHRA